MEKNLFTIAELKAKEGRLDDLKAALETLAEETRKEPGALEYFFVQDHAHDKNTIISYERWKNSEEEEKHWKTPHLQNAISKFDDILDGAPIVRKGYQVV